MRMQGWVFAEIANEVYQPVSNMGLWGTEAFTHLRELVDEAIDDNIRRVVGPAVEEDIRG